MDAAHCCFRKLLQGMRGGVEIPNDAQLALVHQQDMDGLVPVCD